MFKMHPSLLLIVLLTTVTLSSSNVLPILTINKLDTQPLLEDQDINNTFNKHKLNPNIFYKVFIGTPKDNLPKKSQISRLRVFDNDNDKIRAIFDDLDNDDDYNSEGYRKEQWHNYPRQLDRLNKNNLYKQFESKLLDKIYMRTWKTAKDTREELNRHTKDDIPASYDADIIDGPLFILKIRLAYLTDSINDPNLNKYFYSNLPLNLDDREQEPDDLGEFEIYNSNDAASAIKVKRKEVMIDDPQFAEKSSNENKAIKKRIFSLWSRLQSLSHRGHELQHRRHLYTYYGLPEEGGGALTAETRAAFMRPPGSPLRWG